MHNNPVVTFLLVIALILGIAVSAVYLQKNIRYDCVDFLFWRHCGVTTPK